METGRLPLLILTLADITDLVYVVYGFAYAGTFVLTFLAKRVSEATVSFSLGDFRPSILFLTIPLSSLFLYCPLPASAYSPAHGRTWVRWVVQAQLLLRLSDTSPTTPMAETVLAKWLTAPLPELRQADAVLVLLVLVEMGKTVWMSYLVRRQK